MRDLVAYCCLCVLYASLLFFEMHYICHVDCLLEDSSADSYWPVHIRVHVRGGRCYHFSTTRAKTFGLLSTFIPRAAGFAAADS